MVPALRYVIAQLLYWWAYSVISLTIWQRHPIIKWDRTSIITVYLTGAFVFGCGLGHLIEAYSVFDPVYDFLTLFLLLSSVVSCAATVFVVSGLIRATMITAKRRKELESFKK